MLGRTYDGEEHPRIGAVLGRASESGSRCGRDPMVVSVCELAELDDRARLAVELERGDCIHDREVGLEVIPEPADDVFVHASPSGRIITRVVGVVSNVTGFGSPGFVFVIR